MIKLSLSGCAFARVPNLFTAQFQWSPNISSCFTCYLRIVLVNFDCRACIWFLWVNLTLQTMSTARLQIEQSHSGDGICLHPPGNPLVQPLVIWNGDRDGPVFRSCFLLARGDKYWVAGHGRFKSGVTILRQWSASSCLLFVQALVFFLLEPCFRVSLKSVVLSVDQSNVEALLK